MAPLPNRTAGMVLAIKYIRIIIMECIVIGLIMYLNWQISILRMTKENKQLSIKCCSKPLEFILQEGQSWQVYTPETATCGKCNTYYEKKTGNNFAYKKVREGFVCTKDGETILDVEVAHPIWDGPFPMSGSGRCKYENVPYCPKHEKEPNYHGMPIQIKFEDSPLYKKITGGL